MNIKKKVTREKRRQMVITVQMVKMVKIDGKGDAE
jgi:hypothetical protein